MVKKGGAIADNNKKRAHVTSCQQDTLCKKELDIWLGFAIMDLFVLFFLLLLFSCSLSLSLYFLYEGAGSRRAGKTRNQSVYSGGRTGVEGP